MKALITLGFALILGVTQNAFSQELTKVSKDDVIAAFNHDVRKTAITEEDATTFKQEITENQPETKLDHNQFFLAVDKNPKKQNAALVFWNNDTKQFEVYGYTKVSTGSVRKKHFYSPSGWFENLPENGSFRALGTKNENGIRGLGRKGMRVWDFGWQHSYSGLKNGPEIDIRFEMHATDPDYLEQRLGRPDSEGCVRIHNTFNTFLDKFGVIDAKYEEEGNWVLRADRTPAADAGSWILVFDSSKPHDKDINTRQ